MGASDPEWLCVTKDFSHDGVYFLADDHGLRAGMRILLTFPYNEHSEVADCEYLVEVMRVNRIRAVLQERCGVGARLILRMLRQRGEGLSVPEMALPANTLPRIILQHINLDA